MNQKLKNKAEIDLLQAKGYSSKELENIKKMLLTPCIHCAGSGIDPVLKFSDCTSCSGLGVLNSKLDPRRVIATVANMNGAYLKLKNELDEIYKILDMYEKEMKS